MGCFCHATLGPLRLALPQLNVSATLGMPGANVALGLSAWLSAHGMPAAPWQPDPAWLGLPLPRLQLSMRAVATISALAQLRAQVLAQFGLDLLNPAHATAFARIVATLNARLSALAVPFNPAAWLALANLNAAIDQINLALQAGLLPPSANMMLALGVPGGIPMARWSSLLALLRALAPMLAATTQLNVSLTETAQLSAALRMLARLALPPLAAPQLLASLSAALSAVAQLQASLGVNPLALGFPAMTLRVQARLAALLPVLSARFGVAMPPGNLLAELLAALLALLPPLPVVPTYATSAVVQAAMQAQALASLNWQVPAMLPAIAIGLPVCNFAAQLNAALAVSAVLPAPCASGCDAARLMRALA
jgi:hypothetical protein